MVIMAQATGGISPSTSVGNRSPTPQQNINISRRRQTTTTPTMSGYPSRGDIDETRLFSSRSAKGDWCSNMGSQNLASVLNDPSSHRNQNESLFTKDWGSSFVETPVHVNSVSVTRRELEIMRNFLKAVRKRGKTLQRIALTLHSTAVNRRLLLPEQHLEKIPELFLRSDFDLSDVDTFNAVLAFNSGHATSPSTDETISCSSLSSDSVGNSQKTLADVLDLVEDHLSLQISVRFRDFFHIMNAMDILMEQVSRTIKEVTSVRGKCDLLKNSLIKPSLQNILLTRVRKNCRVLLEKLLLMQSLYTCNGNVNSFLSNREYVGALSLISSSKADMENHLPGVKCFQNLSSELTERERLIEKFLEEDLNKLLTAQFLRPFYSSPCDTSNSPSSRSSPKNDSDEREENEALFNILFGMVRIHKFSFVEEFREEACAAVITVIKQTIIQTLSREDRDVNQRQENHLYEQLKDLSLVSWLSILGDTFSNLTLLLERIVHIHQIMQKTLHIASGKEWKGDSDYLEFSLDIEVTLSAEEFQKWSTAAQESMNSLCDFAQSRCSLLIDRRVNDSTHDRMTTSEFLKFARDIQEFYTTCQVMSTSLSSSSGQNLKVVLQNQANRFASRFHEEKKKKLNSLLDIEQWKSMESIPRDFQVLVDKLLMDENKEKVKNGSVPHEGKTQSFLLVSGEKFVIVNSVVLLVTLMSEYVSAASEVDIIAVDLFNRLVDLLKHFNQRTYKLVYLGSAKQTSGLKSVTSRTLINSARSLQLVLRLIPSIKRIVSSQVPSQQESLLQSFDDVSSVITDHVEKIHEKIIGSSCDFISAKLKSWEAKPPVPSPQFLSITQHLGVLNENLEDCLPTDQLSKVFFKIDESFKNILREQLERLNIVNDGGLNMAWLHRSWFATLKP